MFVCMCESVGWLVGWLVCVCVCLRVCLSVWSAGVFICLWTAPECLCALSHCFGRKNKKTPARRFGAGCQKTGKKKCGGREEKKKSPGSPEIYLFWLPASLKLPVGDFKMAPLPATEWALPCQNVFEWENTDWKVSSLFPPSLPHCFSLPLPSFSPSSATSSPCFPPSVHPSSHTERASHPLQWSSHWMLPFAQRKTLSSSISLSLPRWSPARALCLGEVSASHSEVHSSLKHDVYLLGPVCRTVQVLVPFCQERLWSV